MNSIKKNILTAIIIVFTVVCVIIATPSIPAYGIFGNVGGGVIPAWPFPCIGPPGLYTITRLPFPTPVAYPYPAPPLVVKSKWIPPTTGVITLAKTVPGGCVSYFPCTFGVCPIFLPGQISIQYGTAFGI